jgi:hypothetical protein
VRASSADGNDLEILRVDLGGESRGPLVTHPVIDEIRLQVGGLIGFVVSLAGAVAAIPMNLGPTWYPIALALTALPCAWLGGMLYQVTSEN